MDYTGSVAVITGSTTKVADRSCTHFDSLHSYPVLEPV